MLLIGLFQLPESAVALSASRIDFPQVAELNRCLAMAGALQWAFGILFVIGRFI